MAISIDVGTGNIIAARQNDKGKIVFTHERNAFIHVGKWNAVKNRLKRTNISYTRVNDDVYILGTAAYDYANIFGEVELRRPMALGMLNPKERNSLPILRELIKKLLGPPKHEDEICVYVTPSEPIDTESHTVYHEDVVKTIIESLGYKGINLKESEALAYAGLVKENLTGIAISFGAGMANTCLDGATEVPLLNDTTLTLQEMAEDYTDKEFYVYSCDNNGQVVPGRAHSPRMTKISDSYIKITLDDGSLVKCTPDHRIMLRDGSYVEAQHLEPGRSLMPLYKKRGKNDKYIKNLSTKEWDREHRLVYKHFYDENITEDDVVHHIDGNHFNNHPLNLMKVSAEEYILLHKSANKGKTLEEIYGAERAHKIKEKQSRVRKQKIASGEIVPSSPSKENLEKCMESGFSTYERTAEIREQISESLKGNTPWNKGLTGEEYRKHYKSGFRNQYHNHTVLRVEIVNKPLKVYDLTVDKYHNFAINKGIFVHNCVLYQGLTALDFSVTKSGDYIDENAAMQTDNPIAHMTALKENPKFNLDPQKEPMTRENMAVGSYYRFVIRNILKQIINLFNTSKGMPHFKDPIKIVCGGGTSMAKGFIQLFKDEFNKLEFPIEVKSFEIVQGPLFAVARGALSDAIIEEADN